MTATARREAMQPQPSVTAAFLRNYWRHAEGGWVTLFSIDRTTGDRATHWAETHNVTDLATVAANLTKSDRCVWFGAATRHEKLPNGDRGAAKDCDLFPGLWVDIDIAGPAHERADLCADEDAAHALLAAYPLAPTVVIHSGWGLQAWWMLAEPITLGEAASVLPRWGATWAEISRAHGAYVDNVFDAPRIMRLPGTLNHKQTPDVRPVTVLSEDWTVAYGLDDLEPTLRDAPPDPAPAQRATVPYIGPSRPGDAFNATHDGGEILERHGWVLDKVDRRTGDRSYVRPGKARRQGSGATVYANDGHTAVYTTSVPGLEVRKPYDPFGLYVALAHGGDFAAATRALSAAGYGAAPVARDAIGSICDPVRVGNLLDDDEPTEDDEAENAIFLMRPPPPVMAAAAYRGLAGDVVKTLAPETEADPAALLASFLVQFGGAIGGGPFTMASGSRHQPRLFAVIVGKSAKARKSTSFDNIADVMARADPDFMSKRVLSGFGSGESLVDSVADPDPRDSTEEPRNVDRRVMVWESEWARLLKVASRKEATLSPIIRDAWDGRTLQVRSRTKTAVAKDPYVTILANITAIECKAELSGVEIANGFANRFLLFHASRSQLLPEGGWISDAMLDQLGRAVRDRLQGARKISYMRRSEEAKEMWASMYAELSTDEPDGILGSLVARSEAQVLRLSMIYALLDGSATIEVAHLESAAAVWKYCRDTAEYLFWVEPGTTENPDVTKLIAALREHPQGMTMGQIRTLFGRAKTLVERQELLRVSAQRYAVTAETSQPGAQGGRPTTIWRLKEGVSAVSAVSAFPRTAPPTITPNIEHHQIHSKGPCEGEAGGGDGGTSVCVCAETAETAETCGKHPDLVSPDMDPSGFGPFA